MRYVHELRCVLAGRLWLSTRGKCRPAKAPTKAVRVGCAGVTAAAGGSFGSGVHAAHERGAKEGAILTLTSFADSSSLNLDPSLN